MQIYIGLLCSIFLFGCQKEIVLGEVKILPNFPNYTELTNYWPYDFDQISDVNPVPFDIEKSKGKIAVKLVYGNGYEGNGISFTIHKELCISKSAYHSWVDVIDGSKHNYTVDSINVYLNSNLLYWKNLKAFSKHM